ncbi:MAG: peptidase U32 family protein [Fusobacteriaceae bacterium]
MKKIDLSAPAENLEKLKIAINLGADVFVGGKILSMNFGNQKFSDEELIEAVNVVKKNSKKIFVTLNAVPQNEDLEILPEYLKFLEKIKIDGVIISDMGIFQCVRDESNLKIIIQTHSSNTNFHSVQMWKNLGASRIILDRDISLEEILEIRSKVPDIELEVFVHGNILLAISGRSILSNYMTKKNLTFNSSSNLNLDSNLKNQKNSYSIIEETRPNEHMPIFEDEYGTYIFGARELCTIEIINKILALGINSVRIESVLKSSEDLKEIISVYKEALDLYQENKFEYHSEWLTRLQKTSKYNFLNWY